MIKKCIVDNNELQLFLLNYRNTPVAGTSNSPAQLLMSGMINTKLSVKEQLLKPKLIVVKRDINKKNRKVKIYYDRMTRK